MGDIIFRERQEEIVEPEAPKEERETPNLIEGREDGAVKDKNAIEEVKKPSPLEEWEIENGKYGIEFLGIKEISGEFPLKMQFSVIDKYIKGLISEDMTPGRYQEAIDNIEKEIGSAKLGPYERMKKLYEYVNIVRKIDDLKRKREMLLG